MIDVKQFSSDKILAHLDRIWEWIQTGISKPITFELDMTNLCNHRCPDCFGFFDKSDRASLDIESAKEIIYQIKDMGARGVTFTGGGEPLCNPHTLEAVRYAKRIGLDVGFISNGMLIDKGISRSLLKNCAWIRISLDAASPGMFKMTHGMNGHAYRRVIKNISLLVKAKEKLKLPCTIGVGYLTSPRTLKEIKNFSILCRNLKVDYAQFRPLLRCFGKNGIDYKERIHKDIIKEIENCLTLSNSKYRILYSKHKYDSMVNGGIERPYTECYGHHFAAVICADKKMYICCHFRGVGKYCIGDFARMTLKEIWHSYRRKNVYAAIDLKECTPLCRCDSFNTILWNIKKEKVHKNFI